MAELVGGLAHELRNPLSTMMVNLQLLAEDLSDESTSPESARRRARLKVEVLQREASRLQTLFDQFLNLTAPPGLRRVQTDIVDLVRRLVSFVEPEARAHQIEIVLDAPDDPLVCQIDAGLVRQALLNIVINAQHAMSEGGTIRIVTDGDANAVEIIISDTGAGIAPSDADRIFRPFFSTKPRGIGLGLSITRRIIQEHGGDLSFRSSPGRGTTFTVRLPRGAPTQAGSETG